MGEVRQGALEGVMVDAVSRAADVPLAEVRRAAMLAGDLGAVAAAAIEGGSAALARFRLSLLTPVQPMLAQSAEDVAIASSGSDRPPSSGSSTARGSRSIASVTRSACSRGTSPT